jgi:probable rRNA maturation factor
MTPPRAKALPRCPGCAHARGLDVMVLNRQRKRRVSAARIVRLLRRAAGRLGACGEMTVLLTSDAFVRKLNARYRGKDRATDVLSFVYNEGEFGLGDVVISVERAHANAAAARHSLAHEIDILVLHGLIHLLGHDHERDDGTMDRIEKRLRATLLAPRRAQSARRS